MTWFPFLCVGVSAILLLGLMALLNGGGEEERPSRPRRSDATDDDFARARETAEATMISVSTIVDSPPPS